MQNVLKDIEWEEKYKRMKSGEGLVWIKRGMKKKKKRKIMEIGVKGIGLRKEKRRFYKGGKKDQNIIGIVNVDNKGIEGMEKYIDRKGMRDMR